MSLRVAGRCAGAFFLLAFVAYGVGSALPGQPAGAALVALSSALVAAIGALAFRALRPARPGAAWAYLVARGTEAFLLAAGFVLRDSAGGGAADIAYQAAMLSLGLGSVPFCLALARQRWLPRWLAGWGVAGYALLAAGAAAELTGAGVGLVLAAPGGLFELVFGVLLLARGFAPATGGRPGPTGDVASNAPGAGDTRARRAARAAGVGLLLMAVLAGLANFGIVQPLAAADAAGNTGQPLSHQRALVLAAVALLAVACLDVLVAWALRAFLADAGRAVALLAAWCRTGYAVVFAVAITHLVAAAGLLRDGGTDRIDAGVRARIADFEEVWNVGLILFGVHLLLVGWLAWQSAAVPTWVAALVAVAGAGYLADSIGALVPATYPVQVAAVTFVGEVVLMGWLLVRAGRSRPGRRTDRDAGRARQAQPA
ncbi:DUF4386 domain-containing protein [Micromonospora haikouensis]|uniref:DUF4386 domain-containing protein n=1 Tax=Micromonospora haikouensis TaxID=686309 RepID=UPI0037A38CF8